MLAKKAIGLLGLTFFTAFATSANKESDAARKQHRLFL
jgi:hypothetical protein